MIRKATALFLITGSLIFAFLILNEKNIFSQNKPLTKIDLAGSLTKNSEIPADTETNATALVADQIAQAFSEINANVQVEPERIAAEIFSKNIDTYDFSKFNPKISDTDLNVILSEDKKIAENYFKNLGVIIKKDLAKKTEFLNQPNSTEDFKKLSLAYGEAIQKIYQLIVPQNMLELHREELRLLTIRKMAFDALADYLSDPVNALAAATILPEVDKLFLELGALQIDFMQTHKINI